MSHFTVLVIGDDYKKQLEAFKELDLSEEELKNDSRAIFKSSTDSYINDYNTGTVKKVIMPDGRTLYPWDDEFRVKDEKNHFSKTVIPDNLEQREIPFKELFATFEDFMKDYCGEERHDNGEYGYYYNPNAKWDWYSMGGRWTGFFKLKDPVILHSEKDLTEISIKYNIDINLLEKLSILLKNNLNDLFDFCERNKIHESYKLCNELSELITTRYTNSKVGSPGLMTNESEEKTRIYYDRVTELLGFEIPKIPTSWKKIYDDNFDLSHDKKRELYYNQKEAIKFLNRIKEITDNKDLSKEDRDIMTWLDLDEFNCTREEYIQKSRDSAISTYAVLFNGQWYERGSMGWWGVSTNEKDENEWNKEFNDLIDKLPDDTLLTLVDCHI
jgi:hypothetical protein